MEKPDVLEFLGLDLKDLEQIILKSKDLEKDSDFFDAMSAISFAKKKVADALEDVTRLEEQAKGLINAKAKALYGKNWQVIRGEHFKISRQFTGQVYELTDVEKVAEEYLKVKFTPNTRTIEQYRETHDNTLPEGVTINEERRESIRVTIT